MRFISALIVGLVASFGGAQAVQAKSQLYVCKLEKGASDTSWISETTGFVLDDNGAVQVVDSIIMHYLKEAQTAKVRRQGDVLKINWLVTGIDDAVGTRIPRIRYSAKLNTKNKTFSISSRIPGFENTDFGSGSCIIGKAKK